MCYNGRQFDNRRFPRWHGKLFPDDWIIKHRGRVDFYGKRSE